MNPKKRTLWLLLASVLVLGIALYLVPNSNRLSRFAAVIVALAFPIVLLLLAWQYRVLRTVIMAIIAILSSLLWLPGRHVDQQRLFTSYGISLRSYLGVSYRWGGESRLGIDCSGLVRRALIDASISQGFITWNPRLVRYGLHLWFKDGTAKDMLHGYQGFTKPIATFSSINDAPAGVFQLGDLAVTVDGVHVLAFGGGCQWVEADPSPGKVITVTAPTKGKGWFIRPVTQVRWVLP